MIPDAALFLAFLVLGAGLGVVARRVVALERALLEIRGAAAVSAGQRGGDTPLETTSDTPQRPPRSHAPVAHPQPPPRVVSPATVRRSLERKFAEKAAARNAAGGAG